MDHVRWEHLIRGHQSCAVQHQDRDLRPDRALVLAKISPAVWARTIGAVQICENQGFLGYVVPVGSMFSFKMQVDVLGAVQMMSTKTAVSG